MSPKKSVFPGTKEKRNQPIAIAPSTLVSTICPKEPIPIATTPCNLFLGDKKNTRPPYSPILFGVKTAIVSPQKTDSIALHKLIRSILLTRYCHFSASNSQLTSINTNTNTRVSERSVGERPEISSLKF